MLAVFQCQSRVRFLACHVSFAFTNIGLVLHIRDSEIGEVGQSGTSDVAAAVGAAVELDTPIPKTPLRSRSQA